MSRIDVISRYIMPRQTMVLQHIQLELLAVVTHIVGLVLTLGLTKHVYQGFLETRAGISFPNALLPSA